MWLHSTLGCCVACRKILEKYWSKNCVFAVDRSLELVCWSGNDNAFQEEALSKLKYERGHWVESWGFMLQERSCYSIQRFAYWLNKMFLGIEEVEMQQDKYHNDK